MNSEQKQAVEMMEIDTADFHITHRLDDGEEPILHLTTAKNCPNKRDHFTTPIGGKEDNAMKKTEFQASEAGHKFIELYAEPVVANTWLKIALLVLFVVALILLALLYRLQTAASRLKPLVISISDLGRGQVMNYDDFSKIPVDRVSRYYLARWCELYYGRNHATLQRDFSQSLDFFPDSLQSAALQRVNQKKTLQTFLLDPGAPDVDIEIDAVNLIDLRQSPYSAQIQFEKGLPRARRRNRAAPRALDRERHLQLPHGSAQQHAARQPAGPRYQLCPRG